MNGGCGYYLHMSILLSIMHRTNFDEIYPIVVGEGARGCLLYSSKFFDHSTIL